MAIVVAWLGLAIIVGVAADTRGRNSVGWFVLAVVLSPVLAGLLVLALPNVKQDYAIDDEVLAESIRASSPADRLNANWPARAFSALMILSFAGALAWILVSRQTGSSTTAMTVVQKNSPSQNGR